MEGVMIKKFSTKALLFGMTAAGMMIILPNLAMAKATGPCVNCHTMHNSQDGADVASELSGALTNAGAGCIGCHTGVNGDGKNIPYVMSSGAPTYNPDGSGSGTLAGGSFYWVTLDDRMGHNVVGLEGVGVDNKDANMPDNYTPPGWNPDFNANTQVDQAGSGAWTTQLTCAGTNGCHGEHKVLGADVDDFTAISGAHHGDDSVLDGSTTVKSFRFLYGIIGKEDPDWELTANSTDHNQYFGVDRTTDDRPTTGDAIKTINYLCAECHGNFHSGAGDLGADTGTDASSAWLRHPSDYDMYNVRAKADYAGYGTDGTYQVIAPVATENKTGSVVDTTVSSVYAAEGNAIVNCISCHRAHGSPYADLLRWDYSTCEAGTDDAACGCFECHTTKDAG